MIKLILYTLNILNVALSIRIDPILKELQKCTVLIFEFQLTIDYAGNNKTKILYNSSANEIEWGKRVYKSQNINCTALLTVVRYPFKDVTRTTDKFSRQFETTLSNITNSVHFDMVILLFATSKTNITYWIKHLLPSEFSEMPMPSAIYVLVLYTANSEEQNLTIVSGWVECRCCTRGPQKQEEFACPQLDSCYAVMTSTFFKVTGLGKNLMWIPELQLLKGIHFLFPRPRTPESSPFSRNDPKRLMDSIGLFLFGYLNGSNVYGNSFVECPTVTYDYQFRPPKQYFYVGTRNAFKFITPDNVYSVEESFELYVKPFKPGVWVALAVTVLVLSTILQGFSGHDKFLVKEISEQFLSMGSVLLEKPVTLQKDGLGNYFNVSNLLLSMYFLMAVVITNFYKGTVKSDFTVRFPYETKWKYFGEITNHTFYVLLEEFKCETFGVEGIFKANKPFSVSLLNENGIKSVGFYYELMYDLYYLVDGYSILTKFGWKPSLYECFHDKMMIINTVMRNTHFLCGSHLKNVLLSVNNTKIAFVTTKNDLDYHWNFLQKAIAGIPQLKMKLANNRKAKDSFLRNPARFMVTVAEDELRLGAAFRLQALITFGIFGLWERWDTIKFSKPPRYAFEVNADGNEVVALGLGTSNIYLVFYLLLGGMAVSIIAVAVEFSST
ncbi:unnamed protein product [Allacma fusca]|uniref:Ionotropic receptor n=1 Tax=Allacma fusca TaxID=39272 RepID=A0A8J2JGH5_9HEXA|nr:unnamed protein product [Allacma fusca]